MTNNPKPGGKEKRKSRRVVASFAVTYRVKSPYEVRRELGEGELDGIANDLSVGGLSLLTNHLVPAGAVIHMKFRLLNKFAVGEEDRFRKFELQGEARYNFFTEEKTYRIGIRFLNMPQADHDFVLNCVELDRTKKADDGNFV